MAAKPSSQSTIIDVAREAGVSKKTVSRVFNREPNVREDTRDRVMLAARKLNYFPNISARRLRKSQSFLIALVYIDTDANHYIPDVQHGAIEASREHGYNIMLEPCVESGTEVVAHIEILARQSLIDGLILTPPLSDSRSLVIELQRTGVPFVRISQLFRGEYSSSVSVNDESAAAAMTEHLVGLGHREIAFIVGHPSHGSTTDRLRGFERAMSNAGIRPSEALVKQGDYTFESGIECAEALLALPTPPTCIFASNDDMAAGALTVAHRRGIDVPGQLSIAGFDDIPMAQRLWPPLTTIRQPTKQAAKIATSLLVGMLETKSSEVVYKQLDSELVIRETTAAAPT